MKAFKELSRVSTSERNRECSHFTGSPFLDISAEFVTGVGYQIMRD